MSVESVISSLGKWDDLKREDKLAFMDLIDAELKALAREITKSFNPLLAEIGAPLEVHVEIKVSVTDNLRDPRLP